MSANGSIKSDFLSRNGGLFLFPSMHLIHLLPKSFLRPALFRRHSGVGLTPMANPYLAQHLRCQCGVNPVSFRRLRWNLFSAITPGTVLTPFWR